MSEATIDTAAGWWRTSIIDIHPGSIRVRGYAIEELIGTIGFPDMVWLMLRGDLPTPAQGRLLGPRWSRRWTTGRRRRPSPRPAWPPPAASG